MKQFGDVNMYIDMKTPEVKNFESIFTLTSPDGTDPPASSIFNLTTLQAFLNVSMMMPDVIEFPDKGVVNLDAYKGLT